MRIPIPPAALAGKRSASRSTEPPTADNSNKVVASTWKLQNKGPVAPFGVESAALSLRFVVDPGCATATDPATIHRKRRSEMYPTRRFVSSRVTEKYRGN